MKKSVLMLAFLALNQAAIFAQEIKRPREVWVFRSVLDKRPKIITIGLHNDLWLAYDPVNCGVFKIWKDGVNFDGAVYTTKHGPQPTSIGQVYTEGITDEPIWGIQKDGKTVNSKIIYKGYDLKNNKVILRYDIVFENKIISIEENPEYTFRAKDKATGLERKFTTFNVPEGYQVSVDLKLNPMLSKKDLVTDAGFKISEKKKFLKTGANLIS